MRSLTITCDKCKTTFSQAVPQEAAPLEKYYRHYRITYGESSHAPSSKDTALVMELCDKCYDKVSLFMENEFHNFIRKLK